MEHKVTHVYMCMVYVHEHMNFKTLRRTAKGLWCLFERWGQCCSVSHISEIFSMGRFYFCVHGRKDISFYFRE